MAQAALWLCLPGPGDQRHTGWRSLRLGQGCGRVAVRVAASSPAWDTHTDVTAASIRQGRPRAFQPVSESSVARGFVGISPGTGHVTCGCQPRADKNTFWDNTTLLSGV